MPYDAIFRTYMERVDLCHSVFSLVVSFIHNSRSLSVRQTFPVRQFINDLYGKCVGQHVHLPES